MSVSSLVSTPTRLYTLQKISPSQLRRTAKLRSYEGGDVHLAQCFGALDGLSTETVGRHTRIAPTASLSAHRSIMSCNWASRHTLRTSMVPTIETSEDTGRSKASLGTFTSVLVGMLTSVTVLRSMS